MWKPVTHKPKRGPLETQIKKTLKRKRITHKNKTRVGVKTVESRTTTKESPELLFHQFSKLATELQLEVWRYAAQSWLASMLSKEDGVYTRKDALRRTAPHDIGILPHNKSSLFATCSVTRSVVFQTLRMYDEDTEEWAHADAKWFEKGKWKHRRLWTVDAKDLKSKKSGLEIVDFGPLRRSGRNTKKRVNYTGMDHDIEGKEQRSKKKWNAIEIGG